MLARRHVILVALALALGALQAPAQEREKVDLATIYRIKQEAFRNGQVMDHLFWLTDANGPRLTNSPGFRTAADWAVRTLTGWGASNPHLESWGTFGRGWSVGHYSAALIEPTYAPLGGVPKAWSGATEGPVRAEIVMAPLFLRTERDERRDLPKLEARIAQYLTAQKGKLRGKIVLIDELRELTSPQGVASKRHDDAHLAEEARAPEPIAAIPYEWPLTTLPANPKKRGELFRYLPGDVVMDYFTRLQRAYYPLWAFLRGEGVVAVFGTDERGDGGLVFAESTGGWEPNAEIPPPVIALAPEQYARLARLLEKKVPVKVEVDVQAKFHGDDLNAYNVVAEIPGHKKKDELVMLGAHLDSWHGGTGATDNGAGSAVVLEAFRILKKLGLPMERTVRLALWSGEEQGLYGSRGYVKQHFADTVTMETRPEHARLAAYFNLDNGTGKIRGIYLQDNDMVRPIFEGWLAPFKDLGASTISIRDTGGTDHLSFDAVGLPGFQFIQDPLDYNTRTHHSDMDVYEHALPADLMQAAAIMASFVYNAANRAEMLPRKPLPPPLPPRRTP